LKHSRVTPGSPAIVSLREAARRLRRNPHEIKGAALALGVALVPVGRALAMTERDFARLKARLPERSRPEPVPA
jgi:hypothetical protein